MTDSDGNIFEKRFEITVKKVSTSSETVRIEEFLIFPNPASISIFIKGVNDLELYNIFDISGNKILMSNKYNNGIDVNFLQNGIYFLEVINSTGKRGIQKFVVER